jgi:hypothetical protein
MFVNFKKMFAFIFNQGYICGIFGSNYLGYDFENVDKIKPLEWENYVIDCVKKSDYYKKILNIILIDEELNDFQDGLKLGVFNGIAFKFNSSSKKYDFTNNPYYDINGINKILKDIVYKGKKIGKVNFIKENNILDYWICVPIKSYCDRCGYEKFCNCYGFSSLNCGMNGSNNRHFRNSNNICIVCGEFHKLGSSFTCKNCYDENIYQKLKEEENKYENRYITDFREIISHVRDFKRTFFKDKNLKCLNCHENIDPMNGLISCSKKCTSILLGYVNYGNSLIV